MKILCVGGVMDGRFIDLDDAHLRPSYDFRAPGNDARPKLEDSMEKLHRYKLHDFHCGLTEHRYFLAPEEFELDPCFVMDRLIAWYKHSD